MAYTLDCRGCEWAVDEPVELKGEANWLAGKHIAKTGHSVALKRVVAEDDDDFYRGGGTEILREPPSGTP